MITAINVSEETKDFLNRQYKKFGEKDKFKNINMGHRNHAKRKRIQFLMGNQKILNLSSWSQQ